MDFKNDGMIGNLPKNINKEVPTPNADAKIITKLVKHDGDVVGYELSNGQRVSKDEGIQMAKIGEIAGVAVATTYIFETRCSFCHINPASSSLSSCSSVNFAASCFADEPHTDQYPFPTIRHQKFLVLRLLWRFSILTGSRRKVFWLVLLSPPRFGVILDFNPFSPAIGR